MRIFLGLLIGLMAGGMLACSTDFRTEAPAPDGQHAAPPPPPAPPPGQGSTSLQPAPPVAKPAPAPPRRLTRAARRKPVRPRPAPLRSSLARLYQQAAGTPQAFALQPARDTVLVCRQGTTLAVPADAFVDAATRQPIAGPVALHVKEFYTLPDILLQNLTTTSGDRLLETGGMLHLTADAGGRPCELRTGASITIAFPTANPRPGMQLFVGTRNSPQQRLDWQPVPDQWASLETLTRGRDWRTRVRPPRFLAGAETLRLMVEGRIPYNADLARQLKALPRTREEKRALRRAGWAVKKKLADLVVVRFHVAPSGQVANVRAAFGADSALRAAAEGAVAKLPEWSPAACRSRGRLQRVPFQLSLPVYFTTSGQVIAGTVTWNESENWRWIASSQYAQRFEQSMTSEQVRRARPDMVGAYVMSAAQLGWINCDRFLNSPAPKINYVVDAGAPDADVKLVFADERAMMAPTEQRNGKVRFTSVPEGARVTIVAIRYQKGVAHLATRRTTLGQEVERNLPFHPVTLAGLKEEIARLE